MEYINIFYNPNYQNSQLIITDIDTPTVYKGFQIIQRSPVNFHIVKNGVCVGMNAGINGAKKRIDKFSLALTVRSLKVLKMKP